MFLLSFYFNQNLFIYCLGVHYQFDDIVLFDTTKYESGGLWNGFVNLLKKVSGVSVKSTFPDTWIQKSFYAYLSILKRSKDATLWDEQYPSIYNQVLQWYCLVQSYTKSWCCYDEMRTAVWEKIERIAVTVNFHFLFITLKYMLIVSLSDLVNNNLIETTYHSVHFTGVADLTYPCYLVSSIISWQ